MISVRYSTTGKSGTAIDAPDLPEVTPDELERLYSEWSNAESKFDYVASLPGSQACALVDRISAEAKAARK